MPALGRGAIAELGQTLDGSGLELIGARMVMIFSRLTLLLTLLWGTCVTWAADLRVPFEQTVCLQVKFNQGQPESDLARVKELGVKWVRESVRWEELEPRPGELIEFSDAFKRRLAFYKENEIGVLFILFGGNKKAYPPTLDNPFQWLDPDLFANHYALHVAKMLKASGVKFALEIWNEPHGNAFLLRPAYGGKWNGEPPSPWVNAYVTLVNTVVSAIRKYDPGITLLSNDDMWHLHHLFIREGITSSLNGFAVHPYTPTPPEMVAVNPYNANWTKPFVVTDKQRSFRAAVNLLKVAAQRQWKKTPEIWVSEWGWEVGQRRPNGERFPAELVAAYLPRAFIQAVSAGVTRMCWFSMQDRRDGAMGLLDNDGVPRPAYQALLTMTRQLTGMSWVRQVDGVATPTSGLQSHLFTGEGRTKIVLWMADDQPQSWTLPAAWSGAAITDALGNAVQLDGGQAMQVGATPLYITLPQHLSP